MKRSQTYIGTITSKGQVTVPVEIRRALDLYANHAVDFEDALTAAEMERRGISELYSYDADFERMENVTRLEP